VHVVGGPPSRASWPGKVEELNPPVIRKWRISLLREFYFASLPDRVRYHRLQRYANRDASSGETTNYDVYAALYAAGCPRLALLLTDFEPGDPVDEVISGWKLWLVESRKGGEWFNLRPIGFLVPSNCLDLCLREDPQRSERAARGDAEAAAELEIAREYKRLIKMVKEGVPGISGIYERYVETLNLLGRNYTFSISEGSIFPREKLEEWAARGVGELKKSGKALTLEVAVHRADQLPWELRKIEERNLKGLLIDLAEILVNARLNLGFIFAHEA
jgi:hypothetical protein